MTELIARLSLALALAAPGQDVPKAEAPAPAAEEADPAANDPRLYDAYARMVAFLKEQPGYDVTVKLDWKAEGAGDQAGQTGVNLYRFLLRRPGRFRIEVRSDKDDAPQLLVVGDGTAVTTWYPPQKLYSKAPPRGGFREGLEGNPIVAMSLSGSLIDTLPRTDLVDVVKTHAVGGKLVGEEEVEGRKLQHFRLRWRAEEQDLWIGPADEPLPRRLLRKVTVPGPEGATMTLVTDTKLTWKLGGEAPADAFTLALPDDAKRVDDVYDALVSGETTTFVGRPAPELDLKRLGDVEGTIKLADHKGKQVVLLDFWASWCAPCLELKPLIEEIAVDYRDKGVAVYAVDVGESADEVAAFLKGGEPQKAVATTLLDPDLAATQAYGITSIPVVILIGKDGTVRAVHAGIPDNLEATLRAQLDALLADRPLPAPAAP